MNRITLFTSRFIFTATLILLLGLALRTTPAAGQSPVNLEQVQPVQVTNQTAVELTLLGYGFAEGAVVRLEGYGLVSSSFVNTTQLIVTLPFNVPSGLYDVTVTNADRGMTRLEGALLVMGPTAVQPNNVSNVGPTELVVTGVGFVDGAVVIVDDYGALLTTFVSSNMLRTQLPAGVPAGLYTLRVVNPDATASTLTDALTVTEPAATPEPSATADASATPLPTAFMRPLIVVHSYGASSAQITPGEDLDFEITLVNGGQATASNIVATFISGDFVPRATGGVRALGSLAAGEASRFFQPLTASRELSGRGTGILEVQVVYTDVNGSGYSETFALSFPIVAPPSSGPGPTATPTATPTVTPTVGPRLRPQLLINDYQTNVSQLEPGANFTLVMTVNNGGNADAKRVTLIMGGGSSSGGTVNGTPESGGGLSGAGGEFTNFAPVGSSNVHFLGDLKQGVSLTTEQTLIVNATTKPGAYPVKVSFVYNDEQGGSFVDEQVITLLVYGRPSVEMNFYSQPPPFFTEQMGQAPLQLVNTGKSTTLFGNFTVTGEGAQFENNSIFVGSLEPGGYYLLDAMVIPEQPGALDLLLSVAYIDDFNQPQLITRTVSVEVLDEPDMGPIDGEPGYYEPSPFPEPMVETLGQKIWRFVRGLLGLSSGLPEPSFPSGGIPPLEMPPGEMPPGEYYEEPRG